MIDDGAGVATGDYLAVGEGEIRDQVRRYRLAVTSGGQRGTDLTSYSCTSLPAPEAYRYR